MRAFWKFNLLRLGLLVAVLAVLRLLRVPLLMSLLLAAIISMALSYVLLRGPRDELAEVLADRYAERRAAGHRSSLEDDDAAEDAELDGPSDRAGDQAGRDDAGRDDAGPAVDAGAGDPDGGSGPRRAPGDGRA